MKTSISLPFMFMVLVYQSKFDKIKGMSLAEPFWVNLLILVPPILFFWFRKTKLDLSKKQLFLIALFGIAFGIVEASIVIYIRASLGFLPGFKGTIFDVWREVSPLYDQRLAVLALPQSYITFETIRETATMVMFVAIALLLAKKIKEQVAVFMLAFAGWDIAYYVHLWLMTRWPTSLLSPDILFLIPQPWVGQIWYPLLVSSLTALVVIISSKNGR